MSRSRTSSKKKRKKKARAGTKRSSRAKVSKKAAMPPRAKRRSSGKAKKPKKKTRPAKARRPARAEKRGARAGAKKSRRPKKKAAAALAKKGAAKGTVLPEPGGGESLLLVVSGPSGAGKTTLVRNIAALDGRIWRSVSITTRPPRPTERDGVDYLFLSREEFAAARRRGGLLEFAEVHGALYGTPTGPVMERLKQGRDVILQIDVQGAAKVKRLAPWAVFVFVVPPSREEMARRLQERGTESKAELARRLQTAEAETKRARGYDYLVVNDRLERASGELRAIVVAERARTARRKGRARIGRGRGS